MDRGEEIDTGGRLVLAVTDRAFQDRPRDAPVDADAQQRSSVASPKGLIRSGLLHLRRLWEGREPLQDRERRSVINRLFPQGTSRRQFFTRFASLMMLSTAIAVFGILADSTAVVIGAMLVAPLMFPVLGAAAAIVMGWPLRLIRRVLLVAVGSVLAVALAAAISFVVPGRVDPLPGELMARTSPNLLDLGIALAAGTAGAYGQVRRHAANALTGVAVAVALVPPLAVVGITLQLTEWQLTLGALLLFLANVVGIVIAASITFFVAGFVPGRNPLRGHAPILRAVGWAAIAAIIVVLPMQFGRGNVLPQLDPTDGVTAFVEHYVADTPAKVVDVEVEIDQGITEIDIVVASSLSAPSVNALAEQLAEYLSSPVEVRLLVASTVTERATSAP